MVQMLRRKREGGSIFVFKGNFTLSHTSVERVTVLVNSRLDHSDAA